MDATQLTQYFSRIEYQGPREPSLPVLHALTAAHVQHIPFENLDVLLGRGVDLSDDAVFDKLVTRRRGGYCFEHNGLFLRVLTALGFEVTPLSARVRLDRPRDFIPPRTHMFLRVALDGGVWLTDVGVGGASLTSALRFELDREQVTPHEPRRIIQEDGRYFHQVRFGDSWTDVCEFTGEPMPPIDREVANWFTSAHPQSHFKSRLMAARAGSEGRRYTVLNGELKIREQSGVAHAVSIESGTQLLDVLHEHFGLSFAPDTRFGDASAPWPR
jgi:N-hydroxyarylamine O-acetyltransferase